MDNIANDLDTEASVGAPLFQRPIGVAVPAYREESGPIEATVRAILAQTRPVYRVVVVDDGSPVPLEVDNISDSRFSIHRLDVNVGIGGARNAGIQELGTPYIGCVDVEVLPASDWLEKSEAYLDAHPRVGCVTPGITPKHPEHLGAKWRLMFHTRVYPPTDGEISWPQTHCVLFRKEALDAVGGFEPGRRLSEDVDIGVRMKKAGWETHYIKDTTCYSMQDDSVRVLAGVELNRSHWTRDPKQPFIFAAYSPTKRTLLRSGRHILSGRFVFLPFEAAIWWWCMVGLLRFYRNKSGRNTWEVGRNMTK